MFDNIPTFYVSLLSEAVYHTVNFDPMNCKVLTIHVAYLHTIRRLYFI